MCDYPSLREGVYLYTMNPWKNTKKIQGGGGVIIAVLTVYEISKKSISNIQI
jgi:hypothetical protein